MFDIGILELAVIALVAAVVVGPERLPELARQAGQMVRRARALVRGAEAELRAGLGPEFADLGVRDLNPRRALQRHLLDPLAAVPDEKEKDDESVGILDI